MRFDGMFHEESRFQTTEGRNRGRGDTNKGHGHIRGHRTVERGLMATNMCNYKWKATLWGGKKRKKKHPCSAAPWEYTVPHKWKDVWTKHLCRCSQHALQKWVQMRISLKSQEAIFHHHVIHPNKTNASFPLLESPPIQQSKYRKCE